MNIEPLNHNTMLLFKMKNGRLKYFLLFLFFILSACSPIKENYRLSEGHIKNDREAISAKDIPKPVTAAPALPLPKPEVAESTHTVVVSDIPVKEILFALTRDANLNLDIDDDVSGRVTINAIDQTFSAILDRIANSANLRYERKNNVLRVRRDTPFFRNYAVDYLNMSRSSAAKVSVSTELGATGQGGGEQSGGSGESSNSSKTEVNSASTNDFWKTLEKNIAVIIRQDDNRIHHDEDNKTGATDSKQNEDAGRDLNTNLVINKEAGIIAVRATEKQHKEVSEFLIEVTSSAQRQVLIEATIAEVRLNDTYQAGIDWSILNINGDVTTNITQALTDISLSGFTLSLSEQDGSDRLDATLKSLETFGDVSIVSSPKVMALNNQTALLKVVDNLVYFTIDVEIEPGDDNSDPIVVYESEVNTIPVGFVMTVTPFINDKETVTLNVRPTISRVIGEVEDPNPALEQVNVVNRIPVVQVREVESVLKVNSGDVAIIGGLMQDEISEVTEGVPVLSKMPFVGSLFRYADDKSTKTELVIFLKPVVIKHASVNADLTPYKQFLPSVN